MRRHRTALIAAALTTWGSALLVIIGAAGLHQPLWMCAALAAALSLVPLLWRRRPHDRRRASFAAAVIALAGSATAAAAWAAATPVLEPVLHTAAEQAWVVRADVQLTSDVSLSHRRDRWGRISDTATAQGRLLGFTSRHNHWRLSAPVLLIAPRSMRMAGDHGARFTAYARVLPGDTWRKQAAVLRLVDAPVVTQQAPWWSRAASAWRLGLQAASSSSDPDASGLLPALAIGDTSGASSTLTEDMRTSGLAHLSAVSGANASIMILAVFFLGVAIGLRGRVLGLFLSVALIWFVVLARPSPSVLRAAAMGAVMVSPVLAGWRRTPRGGDPVAVLCVAVSLLLVADPWLCLSYGFALSAAATAALVSAAAPLARWLSHMLPGGYEREPILDPVFRERFSITMARVRTWAITALAVTVCAQVAVTPLLLTMGATISWVSVPANILAEPAVPVATVSGIAASAASQVWPPAAYVIARPGIWATSWIADVAHSAADWHHSSADIARSLFPAAAVPDNAVAMLCAVGQGTGFIIRIAPGQAVVIDAGPEPAAIDACLTRMRISAVPLMVLSHFHADHIGGLLGVLEGRQVGRILVSPLPEPTAGSRWVHQQAAARGIPITSAEAGMSIRIGDTYMNVLAPGSVVTGTPSPPNDNCVAVDVAVPAQPQPLRILAPCDLEFAGQSQLLADPARPAGDYDIALIPHHGSNRQVPAFAHWAHPRIALIPVGLGNDYGHPAASTLALWGSMRGTVLGRTDRGGDLVITADPDGPHLLAP